MSTYALLAEFASTMRTMMQIGGNSTSHLLTHIDDYREATSGQIGWLQLQAGAVFISALASGAAGIATGFYPKGAPNFPVNLHLGNGFFERLLQSGADCLGNPAFMKPATQATSRFSSACGDSVKTFIQGSVVRYESNRSIIGQVGFQATQENQNMAHSTVDKIREMANRIIEHKGRGA